MTGKEEPTLPQPEEKIILPRLPDAQGFLDKIMRTENPDLWKIIMLFLYEDITAEHPRNLFLLTEWPNANYTKTIAKLQTHYDTVKWALGWDEKPVKNMVFNFALDMVSHKRGREKNLLQALRGSDVTNVIGQEKSRSRRLFG